MDRQKRVKHNIDHDVSCDLTHIHTCRGTGPGRAEGSGEEWRLLSTICTVMLTQAVNIKSREKEKREREEEEKKSKRRNERTRASEKKKGDVGKKR